MQMTERCEEVTRMCANVKETTMEYVKDEVQNGEKDHGSGSPLPKAGEWERRLRTLTLHNRALIKH